MSCIDRGWISTEDPRYRPIGIWLIPAYLLHGKGSPMSNLFPPITSIPFEEAMAITREILDAILGDVLKETGARLIQVTYGPGGIQGKVLPMANLQLQAPNEVAQAVIGLIGYRLELEKVHGYKHQDCPACRFAIDILQTSGRKLGKPSVNPDFQKSLQSLAGLPGDRFSAADHEGRPGVRIVNTARCWTPGDFQQIAAAAGKTSAEFGIDTVLDRLVVGA